MKEVRIRMMGEDWYNYINPLLEDNHVKLLSKELHKLYRTTKVVPEPHNIFRAFKECTLEDLKVVIIGQDPYPNKHANGIAFSTNENYNTPSLDKIFQALNEDIQFGHFLDEDASRDLMYLCKQGVLFLNSRLTVEEGKPKSHSHLGWEILISQIISKLVNDKNNLCFLALGNDALNVLQESSNYFNVGVKENHLFIKAEHPAAASYNNRDWKHNNCFSQINNYLDDYNLNMINW